jgi:Mrp family chromosome partitioning ATPase
VLEAPYGEEVEPFRILRANVDLALAGEDIRTVLVTGAVYGEGRSTVAAGLATAYALGGRRVALVDLHLRYPGIAGRFDLDGRPGLTDVVLKHLPLEAALARVELDLDGSDPPPVETPGELDVLAAGPEPVDCGEVSASAAVAGVVDRLRATHDLVVLDAPPLLPVGDTRALSPLADALIVVVNPSLLRRPVLAELRRAVRGCPALALGFVATDVSRAQLDPYGGYHYERRPHRVPVREWAA